MCGGIPWPAEDPKYYCFTAETFEYAKKLVTEHGDFANFDFVQIIRACREGVPSGLKEAYHAVETAYVLDPRSDHYKYNQKRKEMDD